MNCGVKVLFEDPHLAVVLKNCGGDSQTFFKDLFAKKKYKQAVNRLDKPVSGLVIIAFSPKTHTALNRLFQKGEVKKEYWAVCKKNEEAEIGKKNRCENHIVYNRKIQKGFISDEKKRGKRAALYWTVMGTGERYAFLRVQPLTGRTHQIRIQLAALRMPIKGDVKYGFNRTEKNGGIRLHAYALRFVHPVTGEQLNLSAQPPAPDPLWKACTDACLKLKPLSDRPSADPAQRVDYTACGTTQPAAKPFTQIKESSE